ncbi:DUF805 domain-containing protein [Vibrio brasiliensis]|uniref:DUF805 domain-containing protein n=1 Tax=Vibrio brasiliensis TaxID=170652 RepID=UPI001EFD9C80|nr:DUF805 domain-containing protein [Vibrio brasiliensis]MCG9783756.1 DUF805 domain-containing protein [Vibrio brasiliensis]
MKFYLLAWTRSFDFSGCSSRQEFWVFIMVHTLVSIGCIAIDIETNTVIWLDTIYSVLSLIPTLSVTVRRLHDINKSGYWGLVFLLPAIGPFWLVYLLVQPTKAHRCEEGYP